MPEMEAGDFRDVRSREDLDATMATGFGPSGEPGTPEHAENVADALAFADGDIYYDYEAGIASPDDFAQAAATSANIASLQSAVSYAREVFEALVADPELLAQVQRAVDARAGRGLAP